MYSTQKINKALVYDDDQIKKYATNKIMSSILVYTIFIPFQCKSRIIIIFLHDNTYQKIFASILII